jgi:hypothetical protein
MVMSEGANTQAENNQYGRAQTTHVSNQLCAQHDKYLKVYNRAIVA